MHIRKARRLRHRPMPLDQLTAPEQRGLIWDDPADRFGVRFDEVDGDDLFVYAKDEDTAAKIEDAFALHISIIASKILGREINVVMVLPRQLVSSAYEGVPIRQLLSSMSRSFFLLQVSF